MLDSKQYVELRKEAMVNAGYDEAYIKRELGSDTINTNWQDEVFRYGYTQNYELSSSGGSEKTNFYISGSYKNDKGIVINTGLERLTGRLNLTHKANDKLTIGAKVTAASTKQHIPHDQMSNSNEVMGAYLLAPNIPVMKNDTSYYFDDNKYNVVGISNLDEMSNLTNRFMGNLSLDYKITKKLTFKTVNSIDYIVFKQDQYINPLTPDGASKNGVRVKATSLENTMSTSNTLTYDTKLKDIHSINVVVGYEVQDSKNDSTVIATNNFPTQEISVLSTGGNLERLRTPPSDWGIISYLSNFQYNLKSKYYVSFSFRRDGSSRFSSDNKWANFWSTGLSWRISEESFMKNFKKINSLRLHASYGTSGNSEIGNYASMYFF